MADPPPTNQDDSGPRFEEALDQLEQIVRELEEGQLGLAEALARYEKGVRLLRTCHQLLEKAERRIELLSGVDADGHPLTTPLDDRSLTLEEKSRRRGQRRSSPPRTDVDSPEDAV